MLLCLYLGNDTGRNTTYKFNFWFKDQIVNSNFEEDQILVNEGKTQNPLPA